MTRRGWVVGMPFLSLFLVAAASGCGGVGVEPRDGGQVVVTEPEKVSTSVAAPSVAPRTTSETAASQPAP